MVYLTCKRRIQLTGDANLWLLSFPLLSSLTTDDAILSITFFASLYHLSHIIIHTLSFASFHTRSFASYSDRLPLLIHSSLAWFSQFNLTLSCTWSQLMHCCKVVSCWSGYAQFTECIWKSGEKTDKNSFITGHVSLLISHDFSRLSTLFYLFLSTCFFIIEQSLSWYSDALFLFLLSLSLPQLQKQCSSSREAKSECVYMYMYHKIITKQTQKEKKVSPTREQFK